MNHPVRLKHASDTSIFFNSLVGFAVAVLVMLGIGGTVYKLVAPGGWLAQLFGRSIAGGLGAILAFLLLSLPLRAERMLLSMIVFVPLAMWVRNDEGRRTKIALRIHMAFWLLVYAVYWSVNYS